MMNLILGHNQFLGISHISEEQSKERDKKFSNHIHFLDMKKQNDE